MACFIKSLVFIILVFYTCTGSAQFTVKGKIIDARTNEPVSGATIRCTDSNCSCGCTSDQSGEFNMQCKGCKELQVSSVGYTPVNYTPGSPSFIIALQNSANELQEIILSANRGEGLKRSEAPVAIGIISGKVIQDTKPTSAEQVLNKISGVNMVNMGNEQHQMSIRQPMTTKSLFLYLEDGIPIRTSGLYNHNALLEMNMAATKTIEVIKGPSSSLYGSEAIGGVVNFISVSPGKVPVLKLSVQGNNIGYKRTDLLNSLTKGKWGFVLSGYYADKKNGFLEYSDFYKASLTARIDYKFSDKTNLSGSLTWMDYKSDMPGTVDSSMFTAKRFYTVQTFTWRKVHAIRYHSTLTHNWNEKGKSTLTALYRSNNISQNPDYRVKDDYRRQGNVFTGNKELAHGEINSNGFHSYSLIAQHRQFFNWKKSELIAGLSADLSPSDYAANYIRIRKDTLVKKYTSYQKTDSLLTNYATRLNNYAAYANYSFTPLTKLRVVLSLRFDYFHYQFSNHLPVSAFSGSGDTVNLFSRVSPKLGFTYNFSSKAGMYGNYSEGFVPPQVTELYTGVKVPVLEPSVFTNYEIGGWTSFFENHLTADLSAYRLYGKKEIISVRLDDGSFANQNTGITLHRGIEMGLNAKPAKTLSIRVAAAYNRHEFIEYVEKGNSYNGNQMANAPNWIYNTELWYKPECIMGLRFGAELQHIAKYFMDAKNSATYKGYHVLNLRAGYTRKGVDCWINLLNATNNYYSYISSKSSFGYSYQLAEPVNINVGLSFDFAILK